MKRPLDVVVAEGFTGGVLAGAVVAVWFFVVDALAGQPFRTPAVLAYLFFARESLEFSIELITFYTILHLGVFASLGAATAWALELLDTPPTLLLGGAFGVLVLDVIFYGALLWTGGRIFAVLPWAHVLGSNLVGGMVLMTYLHLSRRDRHPFGLATLKGHPLWVEGAMTGLIGAGVVAVWFLGLDLAEGRPFRTPAALGSALFLGAQGPVEVRSTLGVVAGYTVVHVAAFAALGVGLVWLARQIERAPQLVLLIALAGIVLEALTVPVLALVAEWVLGALGWWSVAVGNVLAVAAMGWRIWRGHPELRRVLQRPVEVRT
ncbi:MAG TPA: hypothetical protein VNI61_08765 [Gemmatimonadales bacterium]|nr:hypothetical protein [Gemmatimonadales bacterium]